GRSGYHFPQPRSKRDFSAQKAGGEAAVLAALEMTVVVVDSVQVSSVFSREILRFAQDDNGCPREKAGTACRAPTNAGARTVLVGLAGEGVGGEVAAAGGDDREEATIGRDGEFAKGQAAENGIGGRLNDCWGIFVRGSMCEKLRDIDPHEIAGF